MRRIVHESPDAMLVDKGTPILTHERKDGIAPEA